MALNPLAQPQSAVTLFDRKLIKARRNRVADSFASHGFLKERATQDLMSRLKFVRRTFTCALDLGCHTGQLSRALKEMIRGRLICGDISEKMAGHTCSPLRLVLDEEALPFAPESFDLVTSALSLHWVNDIPGLFSQIRHILKPDGLFLASILGEETLCELKECLTKAEIEVRGGVTPRISPMITVKEAGSLLQRAGLALPVTDQTRIQVSYPDPLALLHELRSMGETNALFSQTRSPMPRAVLTRMADLYQKRYGTPDGRVTATFDFVTITGWCPHDSQPAPLARGSAKARLEDFI